MTNLVELALAVAIGMTGAFQSGLESLHKEEHVKAAAYFTEVIEAETPAEQLYWPALYYRAQANAARGERDAALKDTGTLLVSNAAPLIKDMALALYLSLEGDPKDLRPETGPIQFMKQTIDALRKNIQGDAKKRIAGPLSEVLTVMDLFAEAHGWHEEGGLLSEIINDDDGLGISEEQFDDANRTATVLMTMHGDSFAMRIGLVNRNGEWSAEELKEIIERHMHHHHGGVRAIEHVEPPKPRVTIQKEDVDEELASEAPGLIKELGADEASVRTAARRRLEEIKDAVWPLLEAHVNDPDPEIRMTIRELLK